jgi:hypothetical protein
MVLWISQFCAMLLTRSSRWRFSQLFNPRKNVVGGLRISLTARNFYQNLQLISEQLEPVIVQGGIA